MTEQESEIANLCWIDGSNCYAPKGVSLDHCKLCQKSRNEKYKSYALGQAIKEVLKQFFPMLFKKRQGDEQ